MPEPLRIAIFSDSALPILNGVSVSIDSLVRELRGLGHSVHIYTASHFRYRDPDPNTFRFPAFETPWTKGYPLALPPFYPMLRQFRRYQYDLIHSHTPFTIGLVGLRWAQSFGLPIVSTYHTLYDKYAHYIPYFPRRYTRYKIAKHTNFYYNSVDQVITPSEAAKKWLVRHSVKTPVTVIPTSPLGPKLIDRAEARLRLGIAPGQRVLLYVGRIAREKNMGVLFSAAAQAFRQDPSLQLWLVGDGPFRTECVEQARELGIGDRVRFIGFVPREMVDEYYAAADLFVFASMTETQGLVINEAMSYGLPAIAVQGGGAGASIVDGENGFLVRNDAVDLAHRITEVLDSDQLLAKLSQGASRTSRGTTTEHMALNVLDVYAMALKAPRHRVEARFAFLK